MSPATEAAARLQPSLSHIVPALALVLGLGAAPLAAAEDQDPPPVTQTAERAFDLPAQSLDASLRAVVERSGIGLAYSSELTEGRRAPALRGTMTPQAALRRLLEGSGLRLEQLGDGRLAIRRGDGPAPDAGEMIVIEGARETAGEPIVIEGKQESAYRSQPTDTALFTDRELYDTPFSVGVVGQDLIQQQRAYTSAEALKNEPSVFIPFGGGSYGYYDTFGIRGFASQNNQSYRVDGMSFSNQGETAIEDKERIEVLKGPAGLRFGIMPPGGAFNYVRKKSPEAFTASVSMDANSFGLLHSMIDLGGRLGDEGRVGYRLVAAIEDFDSFWKRADGQRQVFALFADFRATDSLTLWASAQQHENDRTVNWGIPISVNGRIFDELDRDTNLHSAGSFYRVETANYAFGATLDIGEDWRIETQTGFNDFVRSDRTVGTFFGFQVQDNGDFDVIDSWATGGERPHWSHQTFVNGRFATGAVEHDLVVGGLWKQYEMSWSDGAFDGSVASSNVFDGEIFAGTLTDAGPDAILRREITEYGAFVTDTVDFTNRWSALFGLRYVTIDRDIFDNTKVDDNINESALSPSLAVMYEPLAGRLNLYALYTEGLEPGGTAPVGTTNEDEDLEPRRSRQAELGAKSRLLDGGLELTGALFWIEQELEFVDDTNTFVQDGEQVHIGLEGAVRGSLTDDLDLAASFLLLDAEQEETGDPAVNGKRPLGVAAFQGSLWATWHTPWIEGLDLNLGAYYVGDRYADNQEQVELDGYLRLDAGGAYRRTIDGVDYSVRLTIENLLDEEYFVSGTFFPGFGGSAYYGAPLNARLSLVAEY